MEVDFHFCQLIGTAAWCLLKFLLKIACINTVEMKGYIKQDNDSLIQKTGNRKLGRNLQCINMCKRLRSHRKKALQSHTDM